MQGKQGDGEHVRRKRGKLHWVTSLLDDTRERDLQEVFKLVEPVSRVYVAMDRGTGLLTGYLLAGRTLFVLLTSWMDIERASFTRQDGIYPSHIALANICAYIPKPTSPDLIYRVAVITSVLSLVSQDSSRLGICGWTFSKRRSGLQVAGKRHVWFCCRWLELE